MKNDAQEAHGGGAAVMSLRDAQLFRALPAERLPELEARVRIRPFERGKVLYFEGQPAEDLWIVRAGQVRLYKGSADGRVTTLDVLEPGDLFGAVSALRTEQHPSSAEALTSGSAWCLPRSRFLALLADEPAASVAVLEIVTGRLSDAHERVRALSHDPAPSRLAQALLRAARGEDEARVTRRELAEAAGTTVETAIRVLRTFQRDHLVEGKVGRIRLLDEAAIREIADRAHGEK